MKIFAVLALVVSSAAMAVAGKPEEDGTWKMFTNHVEEERSVDKEAAKKEGYEKNIVKRSLKHTAFRPSNKYELQAAINDWLSDPAAAEDKYHSHISEWNTEKITDMSELFKGKATFNEDIGSWNTWNVMDMRAMFFGASTFNQNIGTWGVGQVRNMDSMFYGARAFNKDIGSWNVGHVRDMSHMFSSASTFNQDISQWDVRQVTNFDYMFFLAVSFNQDIQSWDISSSASSTNMEYGVNRTSNATAASWSEQGSDGIVITNEIIIVSVIFLVFSIAMLWYTRRDICRRKAELPNAAKLASNAPIKAKGDLQSAATAAADVQRECTLEIEEHVPEDRPTAAQDDLRKAVVEFDEGKTIPEAVLSSANISSFSQKQVVQLVWAGKKQLIEL